jgi:prepilin signal peptidase PulO-like enzyme (type II secretory pathway)
VTAVLAVVAAIVAGLSVKLSAHTKRAKGLCWVASAGAFWAAVIAVQRSPVPVAAALAAGGLAAAAWVDLLEHRVPTVVAYGATVLSLVALAAHAVDSGDWRDVAVAVGLTAVLVVVVLGGLWLGGAMGFGDVRLGAATVTAMVSGWVGLLALVVVAFAAAGVGSVVRRRRQRRDPDADVPFAPALALGWLVAVAIA